MHRSVHRLLDTRLSPNSAESNVFLRHSEVIVIHFLESGFSSYEALEVVASAGWSSWVHFDGFVNEVSFRRTWHISHRTIAWGVGFVDDVVVIL